MAYASGDFYNTFRTGYQLLVEWVVNSVNIEDNTSNVTVTAYLVSLGSSYTISSSAEKTVTLYIDGKDYPYTAEGLAKLTGNQKKKLHSKTVTIKHDADGSKNIEIYCTFGLKVTLSGTYWGTIRTPAEGSETAILDTIPRPTTPTTSDTFNVGNTVTIKLNRADEDFTHTVQYSLNNSTWTNIATGVETSTTWTLPSALATAKTAAKSGTVYIRAITYNGSKNLGSRSISRTYNITAGYASPTVALAISQTNAADIAKYIRGISTVTIKATTTLKYGAKAAKYVFVYGGVEKTITSDSATAGVEFTLPGNAAASFEYSVVVTDSRGFTASNSGTVSTIAYTAPSITSLEVTRGNYDDDSLSFTEASKGNSLRIVAAGAIASLSNANAKQYKIEYRLSNSTAYTTLIDTTTAGTYAVSITEYTDPIFSENASYVLRFVLSDSFNTTSMIYDVPSQRVLLNFSANGKAMAIGGIASVDDAVEVMMGMYATGGIKPIYLADGTDFNEIIKTGLYVGSMNLQEMVNAPMATGSFTLEVTSAGTSGQIMQRYSYCHKTIYRAFVRFMYESTWGEWQPAEGFTAFSISNNAGRIRFSNGYLVQWGRVSITPTAANEVTEKAITFPLAYASTPSAQVTPVSTVPNRLTCSCGVTTDGITVYMTRTNTTATTFAWTAFGMSE